MQRKLWPPNEMEQNKRTTTTTIQQLTSARSLYLFTCVCVCARTCVYLSSCVRAWQQTNATKISQQLTADKPAISVLLESVANKWSLVLLFLLLLLLFIVFDKSTRANFGCDICTKSCVAQLNQVALSCCLISSTN